MEDDKLEQEKSFEEMMISTVFAMRSMHHITLNAMLTQLLFCRDIILQVAMEAKWKSVRQQCQEKIAESGA